jgi:hypothetical protein
MDKTYAGTMPDARLAGARLWEKSRINTFDMFPEEDRNLPAIPLKEFD